MSTPAPSAFSHAPAPMDLPFKLAIARLCNGISPASLAQAHADWFVRVAPMVAPARVSAREVRSLLPGRATHAAPGTYVFQQERFFMFKNILLAANRAGKP